VKYFVTSLLLLLCISCHAEKENEITLVYTTSVRGEYASCGCPRHPLGGISKRAYLVEQLRRNGNVIVLDSGDLFFSDVTVPMGLENQWRLKAELIAESYRIMGIDAAGIGEVDLTMGIDFLHKLSSQNKFPLIATNISAGNQQIFQTYKIIEINGKRIGVISLINPGSVKSSEGVTVFPPIPSIHGIIDKIRSDIDLLILLSHLSASEEEELLRTRRDIDILISAHSGYSQKPLEINHSIIVTAGSMGKYMGILRMKFHGKKPYTLRTSKSGGNVTYTSEWIPIEQDLPDNTAIAQLIDSYNIKIAMLNSITSGEKAVALANAESCKKCHRKQYNFWKATKHAAAYKTLVKRGKHFDPECIGCHTTGFREPGGFKNPGDVGEMKNVQCVACHVGATNHELKPGVRISAPVSEGICRKCHTDQRSPDFNYQERLLMVSCPAN